MLLSAVYNNKVLIISKAIDVCKLISAYFLCKNCKANIVHDLAVALQTIKKDMPKVLFVEPYAYCNAEFINQFSEAAPSA